MIIIDIDMPTECSSCPIYDGEYGECQLRTCFPSRFANVHALFDDRPNNCPLKERPHGEWLSHYEYCKKHDYIPSGLIAFWWCNQCEQGVEIQTNFCPNCGADMRGGEEE